MEFDQSILDAPISTQIYKNEQSIF